MNNFILQQYLVFFLLALGGSITVGLIIKSINNFKVSLLGGLMVIIAWATLGWKIKTQEFYLESPSQNQPAYILKFSNGKELAFFSSRYFKLFESSLNPTMTRLTLQLLNPKICLLVSWDLPLEEAEVVKSEQFATKVIFPATSTQDLCPGNKRTALKFIEKKFNHQFEVLSPTSARNLYYFEHLQ